jgi:hypothetical protein
MVGRQYYECVMYIKPKLLENDSKSFSKKKILGEKDESDFADQTDIVTTNFSVNLTKTGYDASLWDPQKKTVIIYASILIISQFMVLLSNLETFQNP